MPRLHRVGILRRGYRPRQVEDAIATLEASLAQGGAVRAVDVRRIGFDLVRRGYEVSAVDRLMDRFEQRCIEAQLAVEPPWQTADDLAHDIGLLREEVGARRTRFRRMWVLRKGYAVDEVDDLVDDCLDGLEAPLTIGDTIVTADDVRHCAFRRRRRGYAESAVDEAFDRIIDLLLRREALRLVLASPAYTGVRSAGDTSSAGGSAWSSTGGQSFPDSSASPLQAALQEPAPGPLPDHLPDYLATSSSAPVTAPMSSAPPSSPFAPESVAQPQHDGWPPALDVAGTGQSVDRAAARPEEPSWASQSGQPDVPDQPELRSPEQR